MKLVSEELSNSQFYSINQRRIIRIYLRAIDALRANVARGTRRNLIWITSLASRNVLSGVWTGRNIPPEPRVSFRPLEPRPSPPQAGAFHCVPSIDRQLGGGSPLSSLMTAKD